jgi:hypothetical protein
MLGLLYDVQVPLSLELKEIIAWDLIVMATESSACIWRSRQDEQWFKRKQQHFDD